MFIKIKISNTLFLGFKLNNDSKFEKIKEKYSYKHFLTLKLSFKWELNLIIKISITTSI